MNWQHQEAGQGAGIQINNHGKTASWAMSRERVSWRYKTMGLVVISIKGQDDMSALRYTVRRKD